MLCPAAAVAMAKAEAGDIVQREFSLDWPAEDRYEVTGSVQSPHHQLVMITSTYNFNQPCHFDLHREKGQGWIVKFTNSRYIGIKQTNSVLL